MGGWRGGKPLLSTSLHLRKPCPPLGEERGEEWVHTYIPTYCIHCLYISTYVLPIYFLLSLLSLSLPASWYRFLSHTAHRFSVMAAESPDKYKKNEDEDNQPPTNNSSDANRVRDPWEAGLRRRRNQATRESADESGRRGQNTDATTHHSNIGSLGSHMGPNGSTASFSAAGSCGNGPAVLSQHVAGTAGLGPSPSTPFKTPTKDSMLVPVTPSTATISGETAESTIISSPRGHRDRRPQSLRRQYQILENQTYLLLGSTSIGFLLFLVFTLPLFALISLALMAASLAALIPVASSAIQTRYQLEMEQPLGLLRYLPDSIRILLTETTLHEYMSDTTFMMENRYLLLYFIPGIQPDQLMGYINRLPRRHRDALLQPGLGRFMPSLMNRLVRMDDEYRSSNEDAISLVHNGGRGDSSTSSLLTLDREGNEGDSAREVTLIEAITSLRQTLTGQFDDSELPVIAEDVQEDANDSPVRPREVVVELQQTIASGADQDEHQRIQAEYNTEERILSDATSTAIANYSTQATSMVSDTAAGLLESVSSMIVRFGSLTGLVAGSGGIAMAAYLHPSAITLGMFSRPYEASTSSSTDRQDSGHGNGIVYGLFATSAFGFVSAGVSYMIRNRVRAAIAQNRDVTDNKIVQNPEEDKIDARDKEN